MTNPLAISVPALLLCGHVPEEMAARVSEWLADPYAVHNRPPYRAHSFDGDERFYVVGSTTVSQFCACHWPKENAEAIAEALNVVAKGPAHE